MVVKHELPPRLPFIGHLPYFLSNKLDFLTSQSESSSGPAVELQLGGKTYLLNAPADVRHVLSTNAGNYRRSKRLVGSKANPLLGHVLFTLEGYEHSRRRCLMQPLFSHLHNNRISEVTTDWVNQLKESWHEKNEIELSATMLSLAERISSSILFGSETARLYREIHDYAMARRNYVEFRIRYPIRWIEHSPLPVVLRYGTAARKMISVIDKLVPLAGETKSTALFYQLVRARDSEGIGLRDEQIAMEVLALMVSGFETMGQWLAWTCYLLAIHPEIQTRLRQELTQTKQRTYTKTNGEMHPNFTELVLKESLRLYPPTWLFVRMAEEKDKLPTGASVEPGTKIYICPYTLHRRNELFENPRVFDPMRFSRARTSKISPFSFVPFGAGHRSCIGENLAFAEAKLIVESILRDFRFTLVPGQRVKPLPGVTLQPTKGIRVFGIPTTDETVS